MKYFWDTLLDADLESDALGWQYISGTLPDGRELDRIDNPQVHLLLCINYTILLYVDAFFVYDHLFTCYSLYIEK